MKDEKKQIMEAHNKMLKESNLTNAQKSKIVLLLAEANELHERFNNLKEETKEFYNDPSLNFEYFNELKGKRQPKIVMKLFKFNGDITIPMLKALYNEILNFGIK